MKNFIKGIFSETDGSPSSKRIVMFMLTTLFIGVVIVNLLTGKVLKDTLEDQLYYLLLYIMSLVFGEKITTMLSKNKEVNQSNTTDQLKL